MNIEIMHAFVELRRAATSYAAIERRLEELHDQSDASDSGRPRTRIRSNMDVAVRAAA